MITSSKDGDKNKICDDSLLIPNPNYEDIHIFELSYLFAWLFTKCST